jgi:hypothetical protein
MGAAQEREDGPAASVQRAQGPAQQGVLGSQLETALEAVQRLVDPVASRVGPAQIEPCRRLLGIAVQRSAFSRARSAAPSSGPA